MGRDAGWQLLRPEFIRVIVDRFCIEVAGAAILPDDH